MDALDVIGIIVSIIVFVIIVIAIFKTGGILDDVRNNLIQTPDVFVSQIGRGILALGK